MNTNHPLLESNLSRFSQLLTSFLLSLLLFALCFFLLISVAHSAQINLVWDPNTESDLAGYKIYYGISQGGPYNSPGSPRIITGNIPHYTLDSLTTGQTYYIVATAFDTSNNESGYSNEVNGIGTVDTISTPKTPKGPQKGNTGGTYTYSTSGSVASIGGPVEYQFDWNGDGTDLSPWGSAKQSKTWTSASIHDIKARARSSSDPSLISNWSNTISVTVTQKPFIYVTLPNGGETWVVGATHTITWDSGYLDTTGTIYLFYWYGGSWHPIITTPLSTTATSYDWTIPNTDNSLTKPYVPKSHIQSTSIWIGNWVNGNWECWDSSGNFKIIDDGWVGTISGADRGGVTLWFNTDEVSFDGYGVSFNLDMFRISGNYVIDAKGVISGTFGLSNIATIPQSSGSGTLTGKVNLNATKMTLKLIDPNGAPIFNMSGVRLLSEPSIPSGWNATISGDVQGTFNTFTIAPYPDPVNSSVDCAHIFMVTGSGILSDNTTPISMNGNFFFTPSINSNGNIIYGIYNPLTIGATTETGIFSGTLKPNPTKGKLRFNAVSDNGNKYIFRGKVVTP
jgi:hypothetical protein